MSKQFVDDMIHNMKLAGIVTKATPWTVEGTNDRRKEASSLRDAVATQMNVRYVGITVADDWLEIMPANNNLLLKFIIDRNTAYLEFYLANKPPFFKFTNRQFTDADKWETLLGEVKRKLKKDKVDVLNHKEAVGNLYARIKPYLK